LVGVAWVGALAAGVDDSALPVQQEIVRRSLGAIRFGHVLRFVAEIREVEPLLLCALDHVVEAVGGMVLIFVGVDRHKRDASLGVLRLLLDQPVLAGDCHRAVVAGEEDDHRLLAGELAE